MLIRYAVSFIKKPLKNSRELRIGPYGTPAFIKCPVRKVPGIITRIFV